jgi:hypothetical protein
VNRFAKQLADVEGAGRIDARTLNEQRGDCVIEVDAALGMMATKRYYLCVPFDVRTVWVLMIAVVGNDPANHQAAEATLAAAHESLKLLHDRVEKEDLTAALERGKELLKRMHRQSASGPAVPSPSYYEISGPEGPIGYVRVHQTNDTRQGKPGARISEHTWEFGPEGRARYIRMNAFVSRDFVTELIETRTDYIPATADGNGVLTTLDQCVREGESLFSSFSRSDQPMTKEAPPPIDTGPAYVPRVWMRQLPALLGSARSPLHAFSVYDAEIRAPVLYLIRGAESAAESAVAEEGQAEPTAPTAPTEPGEPGEPGGESAAAPAAPQQSGSDESIVYLVREGYAGQPAMLHVDASGTMIKYVAGDVTLTQRSESYIEDRYGPRRQAAEKRLPS